MIRISSERYREHVEGVIKKMTPGPIIVFSCPSCSERQKKNSLNSGNTFGAALYSDGECVAPMLPSFPFFVKCPKCNVFFTATNIVGEYNPYDSYLDSNRNELMFDNVEVKDIPFAEFLTIDEYKQAISEGLQYSNEEEKTEEKDDIRTMRILMWRVYNDFVRDGKEQYIRNNKDQAYENNCQEILSALQEESEDGYRMMRAELYRNLGDFDMSLAELEKIEEPDKFRRHIPAIRKEIEKKNRLTVRVNEN